MLFVLVVLALIQSLNADCLGEFQECASSGACVMLPAYCDKCKAGQYLCPDLSTCAPDAEGWMSCPKVKGTHFDWTLSLEERLDYLTKLVKIDDQIAQMTNEGPAIEYAYIPKYNWLNDDVHSVRQHHATQFPDGCGLGATWSREAVHTVGTIVAHEARALHNNLVHQGQRGEHGYQNGWGITAYGPNMNLVRDPRWGRSQEVYGEDPHLTGELTKQIVGGYQRDVPPNSKNGSDSSYMAIAACCKHYAAYDLESIPKSRFTFNAQVDTRNMWETYLPAFYACVVEARGAHVMCSYNSLNGVPTCGDEKLLNGILRKQWNWPGFVVSDYDAWANIDRTHHYCPTMECAAAQGLKAGLDQEGGGTAAINALPAALSAGNVTKEDINTSFQRLFRIRIKLGMLDPPTMVPWNYLKNDSTVEGPKHLQAARHVASQGVCMYKNNGALPLDSSKIKTIAVIGPTTMQNDLLLGNYATDPDKGVPSILEAIQTTMGTNNVQCTFEPNTDYYEPGEGGVQSTSPKQCCQEICGSDPLCKYYTFWDNTCYKKYNSTGKRTSQGRTSGSCTGTRNVVSAKGCDSIECLDRSGFDHAVQVSSTADVVVVGLGLDQSIEREGHDRSTIDLPAGQYALVSALKKAGKPVVGVFVHGGTFTLKNLKTDLDAILDAWYPGQEGAFGIADVLFGKVNPAGRTPVTWYQNNDDLPPMGDMDLYPNATRGSKGITYRYTKAAVDVPFGFGLSYTTFSYSDLQVQGSNFKPCDMINVTVQVKNNGTVDGDEVVQLYVKQPHASVPVPQVRLAAFERVSIARGQTKTIQLSISPIFHSVVEETGSIYDGKWKVEAGEFHIFVGGGQPDFIPDALAATVNVASTATCY